MKKSNSTKKALGAFWNLGAVALITATIFFVACKQTGNTGGGGKPTPPPAPKPKHAITFSVEGTNGTLKAKAEGVDETSTSPITVEEGKTVTFTAEPSTNYKVKEWKVGNTVVTGNKTTTYTHTVKKAVTVKVSFEVASVEGAVLILSPDKLNIEVTAKTKDGSAITVEGCKETTLAHDTEAELHATGTTVILKGKITELYCYQNRLTELNVQGCTSLKNLSCYGNKLNAQAMTELLQALPAREESDRASAVLYTEQTAVTEGNCKDFSQPAELKKAFDEAKKRNWKLWKRNASGRYEEI